ncbi:MAG: LysM peptidoglycan-binding domain-containing protein [Pseudomonadota bacterium]
MALLAEARERLREAAQAVPGWPDASEVHAMLAAAESAARGGDAAGVRRLSAEVLRRANDALGVQYLLRAEIELQKVQTYTGLSDDQLERIRVAEVALARREGRHAWELLNALSRELAEATKRYVVAAGDSLWIISGRPEVYGNPYLWPLIWDANTDTIKDPNQLRTGQRLKIRVNPTVDEVVQAVERARSFRSPSVRIGEVREAQP